MGSWMPLTASEQYLQPLTSVQPFFDDLPTEAIDKWRGTSGIAEAEVRGAARHNFQQLISVLQTALGRKLPLRIVSDWSP